MLALRLPKDLEERLALMADKTGRTKSALARQAIIDNIEDMEDYYLAKQALEEDDGTRFSLAEIKAMIAEKAQ
jgi:RHH-type transcriptional regulator, rel operon repressor / antitoxin RelB